MDDQVINGRTKTYHDMLNVLKSVFMDVLRQEDVKDDDDFFDLGGDSLAATALVMALDTIGVQLPVSVLFDASTPAGLASIIERSGLLKEASLVTLRPGDARQSVFIAPGAGGSVLEMIPFARRIETTRQICGLQPRDCNGALLTFETIEQAARFYLPLIRASQPHGPYILAGYSIGGLVALELAQILLAAGEIIELLIILDTLTPLEHFSFGGKLHFWARRAAYHARQIRRLQWRQIPSYALGRAQALARDFRSRVSASTTPASRPGNNIALPTSQPILSSHGMTFLRYRPKFFPGSVLFIESEGWTGKNHYPDILWERLARSVAIHKVEGDHETMLFKYSDGVSKVVSTALTQLVRQNITRSL